MMDWMGCCPSNHTYRPRAAHSQPQSAAHFTYGACQAAAAFNHLTSPHPTSPHPPDPTPPDPPVLQGDVVHGLLHNVQSQTNTGAL